MTFAAAELRPVTWTDHSLHRTDPRTSAAGAPPEEFIRPEVAAVLIAVVLGRVVVFAL